MRIPIISAVGTSSSLGPSMTSVAAAKGSSVIQAPLQTGNTFVVGGTTVVVMKTDMAVPIHMMTIAALAMASPDETVTNSKPTSTSTNTDTETITTIVDESEEPTYIVTSTIAITPTTSHTETTTSTNKDIETASRTVSRSKMHLVSRDDTDPPSYDDLHAYLIEAVDRAARQLRQKYIELGVWPELLQRYKELSWPPKIKDPRDPQKEDADRAVLGLVTLEELLEVVLTTALDAGEGETSVVPEGRLHGSITGNTDEPEAKAGMNSMPY
ncbi:hypothetical protein VPNG_05413 [Cytospora leucostoma]|uniref:Uncharacterized protein n=1 Tax=Cytospora leucostoma TaxID=1230097 RepID=A0A423XBG7_9PEZI|nr:hypothetical protein VPNG_05413 [Cytospora leucostoma]